MEGIMNLTSLPPDVIRLIASYGPVIAYRISLLCTSCYKALKEYIPSTYGHLPISKHELLTYARRVLHKVCISPASNGKVTIRMLFLHVNHDGSEYTTRDKDLFIALKTIEEKGQPILYIFIPNKKEPKASKQWSKYPIPLTRKMRHRMIEKIQEQWTEPNEYDLVTETGIYRSRGSCMRYNNAYATIMVMRRILSTFDSFGCLKATELTPKAFFKRFADDTFDLEVYYNEIVSKEYYFLVSRYLIVKYPKPLTCHEPITFTGKMYAYLLEMIMEDDERLRAIK
jgi:hypothetical protein